MEVSNAQATRDLVVIGASAGGVAALMELVKDLPRTRDAAVLIVMHLRPDRRSFLEDVLDRRSALPVHQAEDGMPLERGRIYVPVPDRHLLVTGDHIHLRRGPRSTPCSARPRSASRRASSASF